MTSFHVSHAVSELQVRPDAGVSCLLASRGFPFLMGRASTVKIFADVEYGQNPLQPWIVSIYQLRERFMIVAAFFDSSRLEQFPDGMLDTFELILLVIFEKVS